jgi:NAD(P)-dependent dehydrogenase (short-subunit alcohol dehydrogenase family)
MTQLLAATLSPLKIRVNSVVPGLFKSQLTTDANGELYGVMQDQVKNIPLEYVPATVRVDATESEPANG